MDESPSHATPDAGTQIARPYRSKKQRPCDGCRRRRVGCFVASGQPSCTLCVHRGTSCTFELAAPIKKGRRPRSESTSTPGSLVNETHAPNLKSALGTSACPPPSVKDILVHGRPGGSTVLTNHTVLYAGNSSDQDVYLLRHLPFDESDGFGGANWRVWKVYADEIAPAYFTSYPNELLDAAAGTYDMSKVDLVVSPYQTQLLDLYYAYVHCSLPVLESRERLEAAYAAGSIPASLMGAIYCSALPFWRHSPDLAGKAPFNDDDLRESVFESVLQEAKTPCLHTVRAMLLYMQLPPQHVREPNHPGFWALTNQLVGLAQETGLHIDPANWNICPLEKHSRRILWWAVYMHDKWLAHWLGRPSHIDERQFSTAPLTLDDLRAVSSHHVDARQLESMTAFMMLSRLTTVLSSILDHFYIVKHSSCVMPPEEALSRASQCQAQLKDILEQQGSTLLHPTREINNYAFVFAYYGIAVSIQRALFACVGGTLYYDVEKETALFQDLFGVFEDLLEQDKLVGLWLSYCKSNIAIIGSFMVTALLASTDNEIYQTRRGALDEFRRLLQRLAERFDFAALPLLRLNLLLERFADNEASRAMTPSREWCT